MTYGEMAVMAAMETNETALVAPSVQLRDHYLDMARDFRAAGEAGRSRLLVEEANFAAFVGELEREARGNDLRPGHVPQTTYWLLRPDGAILGSSRLRHHLNPALEILGGHIGYEIRPSERRKGYGTRILDLTLTKAREIGLTRVLLTCDDGNLGSARVIERNVGVLADRIVSPETGRLGRRYWISLESPGLP